MLPQNLGSRLRARRIACGLSQAQLSQLSGKSQQQISHIERGRSDTTLGTVESLARALGLDVVVLLVGGQPELEVVGLSDAELDLLDRLARLLPDLGAHRRQALAELVDAWGER